MEKQIKRLHYLNEMLNKYKHRFGANASARMLGWVYEYDQIRVENSVAFKEFCKRLGVDEHHNAGDCLA